MIIDPIAHRERLFNNALEDALSNRRQKKLDPEDMGEIMGVCNESGEYIRMHEPIPVTTALESWMVHLEFLIKHAVANNLLKCYKAYEKQ